MSLLIEAAETTRVVRMNRGENRFNREFIAAIMAALAELEADSAVRAVVFTGAEEKYFSNGLDLNWIAGQSPGEWAEFLTEFVTLLHRVFTFPKPVVAAINGHAFAGGMFLACGADWRVMRQDRGWCCIPEIDLRLELPPGHIALLVYTVGHRQADWLSLSGCRLTAEQAVKIGLVDEAVSREALLPRALEQARLLGAKNPRQYASHKQGLRGWAARALIEDDPKFVRAMLASKGDLLALNRLREELLRG